MAEEKRDLARAGTIEITSKEGKAFLEKNLTEWKKPHLMDQFEKEENTADADDGPKKKAAGGNKRKKAAKGSAAAKKPKMSKANTMAVTAKEGAELLGGEKLGDTRQMTKVKAKPASSSTKRTNTMAKTLEEAKAVCGTVNSSEGRKLRKRSAPAPPPKKTPLRKAGTMAKTAKEGKEFLKRGRQKSAKTAS